jgi:hypothetical protein
MIPHGDGGGGLNFYYHINITTIILNVFNIILKINFIIITAFIINVLRFF